MGGTLPLKELSKLRLADFRSWLAYETEKAEKQKKPLNASTLDGQKRSRARHLSALRSFFTFLSHEYNIENNALPLLKAPRLKPRLPRPLSMEEARQAPEAISDYASSNSFTALRDHALFSLLYGTGLRISEALSLTISDVHRYQGEALLVKGKGGKERFVPLLPAIYHQLQELIKAHPYHHHTSPLFCGVRGKVLHPAVAQRTMRLWRKSHGLPDTATPHAFRHAFASHLMQNGADLRAIQELLGHASLSSTQIYTLADESHLLETWEKAHPRADKPTSNKILPS